MNGLDRRRIGVFLAVAFGIAWAIALVVALTGGLVNSPILVPGTTLTLAFVLIAFGYMFAPALAHLLTRLVTREGWQGLTLRPRLRQGWPYYLAAWIGPAILTIAGTALFFALFPQYFDAELGAVQEMMQATQEMGVDVTMDPWMIVALQTAQAVLLAPLINSFFTFGEEFGWRGYLQNKLLPLGGRRAMLWMGLIWGVWHWPVIAMGHNYGLDYPGAPWLGMLGMVWFTLVVGTFLGWVTLRSGSVWPAVIGHAAVNGIAALGVVFLLGQPNPLLGPLPTGLIASLPWAATALLLFLAPRALRVEEEPDPLLA